MKKIIMFSSLLFISSFLYALTGREVLKKMDEAGNYKTAKMNAVMKIIDIKGRVTEMSLESYEKKEGDMGLMRFTEPARLNGTSILTKGDNIWYYNSRTNRVRLLSKSAKKGSMMGSSFSYEDMSSDYIKDFDAEIAGETDEIYKIKMIPKDKDKDFKYIITDVRKKDFAGVKSDYYNKNDLKYKELTAENVKSIKGHVVALKIQMTDITAQKTTVFEMNEGSIEYDTELKDSVFSERNLKK